MKQSYLEDFYKIFDKYKPVNIGEIGTHDGRTGMEFCKYCLQYANDVRYTGYDIFELGANSDFQRKEFNGKGVGRKWFAEKVFNKLRNRNLKFRYKLVQGFTDDTLTKTKFDFVFIDGGHSYDTVKHDYSMVSDSTVIVFDDYYQDDVKKLVNEVIQDENIPLMDWNTVLESTGLRAAEMPKMPEVGKQHKLAIFKE